MRMLKLAALAGAAAMATPAFAVDFTFNPTPGYDIIIPGTGTSGEASPYPINFVVAGLGSITDVNVTLTGLSHSYADDLRIWLVGPDGSTTVNLLRNAGGASNFSNNNITFDQQAGSVIGDNSMNLNSGWSYSFRPSSYDPSSSSSLNDFNGMSANGTWKLFIYDDSSLDTGKAKSATLSILATAGAVPEPATWGMMLAGFAVIGTAMRRRTRTAVSFA